MPAWDYDLIISSGGPAGLTTGIFELSERLRQQAEGFEVLLENGEVSEIIPGQPVHSAVMEGRRRPRSLHRLG